jgi:exonuclease SbcC
MLKKLEVWDFECHEHSVLDGFAPGLNGIFGESDCGKTSLVRALKLVAYNQFDPASVRVGSKNCKVRAETERGYVMVTRGKDNIWEVCRNGEQPKVFSKIGKNVLPEAVEVLGLKLVKLGDMEIPANIMDQNESHFMLNQIGGSDASGSMRAQIVDEISGLSGIEGLIKEVSLDRHRFGRVVKEAEDKAIAIRQSMHDKSAIEAERTLLAEVQELASEHDECESTASELAGLLESYSEVETAIAQTSTELVGIPNTKVVSAVMARAKQGFDKCAPMKSLGNEHGLLAGGIADNQRTLGEIPDAAVLDGLLTNANEAMTAICEMDELYEDWETVETDLKAEKAKLALIPALEKFDSVSTEAKNQMELARRIGAAYEVYTGAKGELEQSEAELAKLPDTAGFVKINDKVLKIFGKIEGLDKRAGEAVELYEEIEQLDIDIADCQDDLTKAKSEEKAALADVDICPVTLKPLSAQCSVFAARK